VDTEYRVPCHRDVSVYSRDAVVKPRAMLV
jgi:hypothetical protein